MTSPLTPAGGSSVRMTFWNSDGSRAAMCGNTALCSARLSVSLGLVPPGPLCLLTDAGAVEARADGQGELAEIRMPDQATSWGRDLKTAHPGESRDPG